MKKLETSYSNYQHKVRETERVLKNLSGATYKELTATKRTLQRELQKGDQGNGAIHREAKSLSVGTETDHYLTERDERHPWENRARS